MSEVIYDSLLGAVRQSDGGSSGGSGGETGNPGVKLMVCRVFADEHYGMAAYLDAENGMEFAGYCADGIRRLELHVVSANPACEGNIVLTVGGESFVVPVAASVGKAIVAPSSLLTGRISIGRNTEDATDTLKDDGVVVTAKVVDWRCF